MRIAFFTAPLLASVALGACLSAWKPPEIKYDDTPRQAVLQPDTPKPVKIVEVAKPLPLPGQLKPVPAQKAMRPRDRFAVEERDQRYSAWTRAPLSCAAGFVHWAPGSERRDGGRPTPRRQHRFRHRPPVQAARRS